MNEPSGGVMRIDLRDAAAWWGRVACVDGCFDPLHHGHIRYFAAARDWLRYQRIPSALVCLVAPDEVVAAKHPVLVPADGRAEVVGALRLVDHVVVAHTVMAIEALAPTHLIKGAGWESRLPADLVAACRATHTAIKHVVTGCEDVSSSAMLARVTAATAATAVDRIAHFAHTQPPSVPWTPVVDYSYEARCRDEAPLPDLLVETFRPTRVLDYGCGPGHLVRRLVERGVETVGYDPYVPGVDTRPEGDFDLVVCREVLEHVRLAEWPALLGEIVRVRPTHLYLTTRFHPAPAHWLDVTLDGHREIDPSEITFATPGLLRTLVACHGYRSRPDLAGRLDWRGQRQTYVFSH